MGSLDELFPVLKVPGTMVLLYDGTLNVSQVDKVRVHRLELAQDTSSP